MGTYGEAYKRWWHSEAGKAYQERARSIKLEQHKKYEKTEKGKVVSRNTAKRMRKRYPEKFSAREKLRYEVRMGRIQKLPCQICGDIKSQAHHEDYAKPLEVIWLCQKHHNDVHNNLLDATSLS